MKSFIFAWLFGYCFINLFVYLFTSTGPQSKHPVGLDREPTTQLLMNEVAAKIPSKWRVVGLQLGLKHGELDGIAANCSNDTSHCYSNVFEHWKNSKTHPYTWLTIVNVLQAPSVNEERLADEIKSKYQ